MSRHFLFLLCLLGPLVVWGASDFTNNNTEEINMGPFGEKKEYIISPPFEGYLYDGDKPLSNTTIIRSTSYNKIGDKWEDEEFQTDEKGFFKIPEKIVKMRLSFLSQFVAHTELYIDKKEINRLFWYSNTTNSENINKFDQYIGSSPNNFVCDLTNDEVYSNGLMRSFKTRCRWENMPSNDPDSIWN